MSDIIWDGKGLPPIGAKVLTWYPNSEFASSKQAHNKEAVIVAHNESRSVAIFEYEHEGCLFYHGFYSGYFRPIKSEREKAIEDIGKKILEAKNIFVGGAAAKLMAEHLYDNGLRLLENKDAN